MIGKLTGKVDSKEKDSLILDVNGVGYLVHVTSSALAKLNIDEQISFHIITIVREDNISLVGFLTKAEKQAYNALTTVKGVGAKAATAILSVLTPNQLTSAIMAQDKSVFKQVSGVGGKIAERILVELKNNYSFGELDIKSSSASPATGQISHENSITADAIDALTGLGINRADAFNIVNKIYHENNDINLNDLIKKSLQATAKS